MAEKLTPPHFISQDPYLVAGNSNPELFTAVAEILGINPDFAGRRYPDGESHAQLYASVARKDVFVLQSLNKDQHIIELMVLLDAIRRASAGDVTAILPYMGYLQGDRKTTSRTAIPAGILIQSLVFWGANQLMTLDPHFDQVQGMVKEPFSILFGSYVLIPAIKEHINLSDLCVIAPDAGSAKRNAKYAELLGIPFSGIFPKKRNSDTGETKALSALVDLKYRRVLLIDDVITTAGTICMIANLLYENGANEIYVAATHGKFVGDALTKIENSPISKVFVTDTIQQREEVTQSPNIVIVSIARLIAQAIQCVHNGDISGKFVLNVNIVSVITLEIFYSSLYNSSYACKKTASYCFSSYQAVW